MILVFELLLALFLFLLNVGAAMSIVKLGMYYFMRD